MRTLLVLSLLVGTFNAVQAQLQKVEQQAESSGTKPAATVATTATKPLSAEKQIRKTVVFIRMLCTKDGKDYDVRGTGFWVGYPDERLKGRQFTYLVTNRHVAECWDDDTAKPMKVRAVWLRLNLKNGPSSELALSQTGNVNWILPSDDSVDLAVLPGGPSDSNVDFMEIPTPLFLGNQEISEGDKIVFSGFFSQFAGLRRMEPIVREGILAMMPEEDITTTTNKPGKLYLGDVHIFNGNSGSPVLIDTGGLRGNAFTMPGQYRLLGVVSGMFYEDTDLTLQVTTSIKGTSHGNSGIAAIVPVQCLKDLLEDSRLKAIRDAEATRVHESGQSGSN